MKKYFYILLCAILVLTVAFGQALAASMWDCDGIYLADFNSKWAIKKAGKDTGYNRVYYDVYPYTTATGSLWIYDINETCDTCPNLITGDVTIAKGKKLLFTIDSEGYQWLAQALAEWLAEISVQEGFLITDPTVYFTFIIPKPSKISVDKKTGDLKKVHKLKIKGWVEAQINWAWMERKFKLQAKGKF